MGVSAPVPDAVLSSQTGARTSLEIRSLSFAYPRRGHRLVDVSLVVGAGELCCLLGPNGAGKTTLLRCVLGLLTPDAGTILVNGADTSTLSERALARLVAYVPQATTSAFPFTALDMVVMGRTPHVGATASPSRADRLAALEQMDRLGIVELAHSPFSQLSGGERQLTLLARALVQGARVLILDEPTASLDYGNEVRFLDLAAQLVRADRTVLMTTHQPSHALSHADRAVLMCDGTVVADGPAQEVVNGERLSELYGVRMHVVDVAIPGSEPHTKRLCVPVGDQDGSTHRDDHRR